MLKIYNTLTKQKEEFKSINPGKVGMYVCGPTVYDYIHIGNIKAYLMADLIRRYLEYSGYEVRHIKNITDVGHLTQDDIAQGDSGEDKLLKKALAENKTPADIANYYEKYFHETEEKMNILPAHYFPRATAHIPQMIKIISGLIEKNFAYEKNGNVFFDVTEFPEYGKLSGNTLENLKVGARLEEHPDKKNPWDFALWLKAPKEHLLKWDSPWSLGYPGWHIECSAMSTEYLGDTLDIHTGGEDNIFPHHEAEIAQTECYTGKKFVNYWIHARHLMVDGQKMSKSKGNFYKLEDVIEKNYTPAQFRLLLLTGHYRSQINFTWASLDQAKVNLKKISEWINNLENIPENGSSTSIAEVEPPFSTGVDFSYIYLKRFEEAMNDDFNTPLALSVLYDLITETNKLLAENKLSGDTAKNILAFWKKINKVLGLIIPRSYILKAETGHFELTTGNISFIKAVGRVPEKIMKLAKERIATKSKKRFAKADELRKKIESLGYIVEDLKDNNYLIKKQ